MAQAPHPWNCPVTLYCQVLLRSFVTHQSGHIWTSELSPSAAEEQYSIGTLMQIGAQL
jgi:hypothetical protein